MADQYLAAASVRGALTRSPEVVGRVDGQAPGQVPALLYRVERIGEAGGMRDAQCIGHEFPREMVRPWCSDSTKRLSQL